jgi:hypothetical protein
MGILTKRSISAALKALGQELSANAEILVVGGGAGVLTGELTDSWTTSDVDAVEFKPPGEIEEVLRAAAQVARRLELPANWLNSEAGLYVHDLPRRWRLRRVIVGEFGKLRVWALGRRDLIATKFYAHRPVDRLHLESMNVTSRELSFVRSYLKDRAKDDPAKAAKALAYVDAWEVRS